MTLRLLLQLLFAILFGLALAVLATRLGLGVVDVGTWLIFVPLAFIGNFAFAFIVALAKK